MALFGLYESKKERLAREEAGRARAEPQLIKSQAIPDGNYIALMSCLDEMQRKCIGRVILTQYESSPSPEATGRWIQATPYYPFEMLHKEEQGFIRDGKTYTSIALVLADVNGIVQYPDKGVEIVHRTHMTPFLPRLKAESDLNYFTESGIHANGSLEQFAGETKNQGWTPEAIKRAFEDGARQYHQKTLELSDAAGLTARLQQMEQRGLSTFEQMMTEARKNIKE